MVCVLLNAVRETPLADTHTDYYIILAVICVLVVLMSVYHDDVSLPLLARTSPG